MKNNINKAPVKFREDVIVSAFYADFCLCPKLVIIITLRSITTIGSVKQTLQANHQLKIKYFAEKKRLIGTPLKMGKMSYIIFCLNVYNHLIILIYLESTYLRHISNTAG